MTKVVLDDDRLFGNHRPEFRPTDSDRLHSVERDIAAIVTEVMARPLNADAVIFGNQSPAAFREQLLRRAQNDDVEQLRRGVFDAWQQGYRDAAAISTAAINSQLARMRSPVRLRAVGDVRKADVLDFVVDLPSFNMVDPRSPEYVAARFQAGNVLSSMAADVEATIGSLIEEGFTAQRKWSTGRITTGLTTKDRAQAIYAVLDDLAGGGFTGADYASQLAEPTRGLFPRWAGAVTNRGNTIAYRLIRQGKSPEEAWRRALVEMERHGAKLRRARARMIARTEVMAAQNAAILAQHGDMIDAGLVSSNAEMEWITGPFDVCEICQALGGSRVPAKGGSFATPNGIPPAHPNCRCKTRLVPSLSAPPERVGTGTKQDPFRYRFADGWEAAPNPTLSRS
jgi:hypothetical protein